MLGASIVQYDRTTESLLRAELHKYDVIVNCVLWDVKRSDHIIANDDLKKMKNGSMIIDVSCDKNGGIETSIPTSIEDPIYVVDGIVHYAVDHTPALFYKTFSAENSKIVAPYINDLICKNENNILKSATIIDSGNIIDKKIIEHQNR
jgi:N5-(carboxyethyl)ornithine synthase